jgi:hypothetical protein
MAEALPRQTGGCRFGATLARPSLVPSFDLAKAPWIRPGVVVHEPTAPVDDLLADFALDIRERGFAVSGFVQRNNRGSAELEQGCAEKIELLDLASSENLLIDRFSDGELPSDAASDCLRKAMREDADLVVINRFHAFENAAQRLTAAIGKGASQGMPVLTSIAGRCVHKWQDFAGPGGTMIAPDLEALWQWWGPERIYRDLTLGVPDDEVRRISCGQRWLMVEGPHGAGLAFLPQNPREMLNRLPKYRQASLRQLAELSQSWDPLEMAGGLAAINAHYNRFDLEGHLGSGAHLFHREGGRVVAVGVFPGLAETLPNALLIKHEPGRGEYPLEAMESLLPGCTAVVATASNFSNRKLPRILRLAQGARTAVVGPVTPLTPRLYRYGVDVLGGLIVHDPAGLAEAVRGDIQPRDFERFGHYLHIRR